MDDNSLSRVFHVKYGWGKTQVIFRLEVKIIFNPEAFPEYLGGR